MTGLARRLRLGDALTIGLGAMLGAGVFAVWAPAAAAAGEGLLVALAVAAVVAWCNATSSAQLAARYPTSGGTYAYGRAELGPWWGFLAGWGFVIGKTASCAAMALTFATYLLPPGPGQRLLAVVAVVGLAAVNYRGVTRTARLARVLVAFVLLVLALVIGISVVGVDPASWRSLAVPADPYGVLQASGLLFFAFAGYARIATLGEEVVDPRRTIPRAITLALAVVVVLYALLAFAVVGVLGVAGVAGSARPVADAVAVVAPWAVPAVTVGASVASLGALLALIAGVGRTALAMAREGDLPQPLAAVHPRFQVPHRAEVALAVVVCALVLTVDLRGAIGFSSFGVLLYYAVANLAALRQAEERRYPRFVQVLGLVGCLVLVATLPWQAVVGGVAVFVVGVGFRWLRLRRR